RHDGILVLDHEAGVGTPAAAYFSISTDSVFEIGLTPNRTDAMCHKGVARDLAAAINARGGRCVFHPNSKMDFQPISSSPLRTIEIENNTEKAPKFGGYVIEGIQNNASPTWLKERLAAIGESSKNLLVDVTNYILHDLGQP
ncbi:MAG: phenylalanine--tRNA ligase beta subunit-related protein, partial [bacterium]